MNLYIYKLLLLRLLTFTLKIALNLLFSFYVILYNSYLLRYSVFGNIRIAVVLQSKKWVIYNDNAV